LKYLIRLYRKWFGVKAGAYETEFLAMVFRPAYDPSLDEDKVMKGEVESYFD
jgi:hypothetical protein